MNSWTIQEEIQKNIPISHILYVAIIRWCFRKVPLCVFECTRTERDAFLPFPLSWVSTIEHGMTHVASMINSSLHELELDEWSEILALEPFLGSLESTNIIRRKGN